MAGLYFSLSSLYTSYSCIFHALYKSGRSYVPMKRETGKGSACSSLVGVKELVIYISCSHTKHNSTA